MYFSVNMFVVSIISEGILLQLTDHLLFGESDPASFPLKDKLLTRIILLLLEHWRLDWSVTICVIMNGPPEPELEPEQSTL